MAKKFFGMLLGMFIVVGVVEAKTTSKTASETEGITVGGGMSLGDCYFTQTGVSGTSTEVREGKTVSLFSNTFVQIIIYYTCDGKFENVFEIAGGDSLVQGELVVSADHRIAWLKKKIMIEKDWYPYVLEIDVAIIAEGEPFFSDSKYKGWTGSKSFQQVIQTKSQYNSGHVFGTLSISGFNYLDNGFGYIYETDSKSAVTNK
ncbi:MAG: hypothetical protein AAB586_00965 [Patescibacteria group bacterium]|mgnify:CR=1 FL=1